MIHLLICNIAINVVSLKLKCGGHVIFVSGICLCQQVEISLVLLFPTTQYNRIYICISFAVLTTKVSYSICFAVGLGRQKVKNLLRLSCKFNLNPS